MGNEIHKTFVIQQGIRNLDKEVNELVLNRLRTFRLTPEVAMS